MATPHIRPLFLGVGIGYAARRRAGPAVTCLGIALVLWGTAVSPVADGLLRPSERRYDRPLPTARLYRRTGLPIILSGGRVHAHQTLMGPISRRFLVALGVPPDRILLESRSRNTFENARASWELCRRRGFRRPLVVTQTAHMPRAKFCFRKLGIPTRPAPCGFRTWEGKTYRWPDFLPRSFEGVVRALHEFLGL
jgi:uncharacterized SAM-binding protein YcdF (DUF218 family)